MLQRFFHCHLHTTHSVLDGVTQISALVNVCKKQKIQKIAVTNHGNVINMPEIVAAGLKEDVQIVPGCEFYMCWDHSRNKKDTDNKKAYHMIGLAMNNNGWKNLMRLSSEGFLSGYYYKPRIDKELLEAFNQDIIFTTACLNGVFNYKQMKDLIPALDMYEDAMWLKQVLKDRLYFEIQRHPGLNEQEIANCGMIELARKANIPLVATCDSHYAEKEHFEAWRSIMLLQTQGKFGKDALNDYYIKTEDEMIELFKDIPEAIDNTLKIAERCSRVTFDKSLKFPKIDTGDLTEGQMIRAKSLEGLTKIKRDKDKVYKERMEMELTVIDKMGFNSYILIVADFIQAARDKKIRVAPGRGSAAGSLICYLLGITKVDPIKYNLLFERFLNIGRSETNSPPDIDCDFDALRRDEMKDYMVEKYGKDKVASIMTIGTHAAKMALRDIARVKDIPYAEANMLAGALPDAKRGKNVYLEDVTDPESPEYSAEFMAYVNQNPKYVEIMGIAKVLEGGCKSVGTHAAGLVISDHRPLVEHTALMLDKNKRVITQNDMKVLEKSLGLIKFDFLALSTLTTIEMTRTFVKELQDIDVDIDNIPEDDTKTYDLLCSGKIDGVFQLSGSEGFKSVTAKIAPRTIEEIADITSIYRPGPLDNGFIPIYTKAKQTGTPEYMVKVSVPEVNRKVENLLRKTKGTIIYQEQILELVKILAGYSLAQADILRRAMGKKIESEMKAQKETFIKGCKVNKIPESEAVHIFETIERFAEYSFNLSHAIAYSIITYQTAYLKAHYPKEFMAALLNEYIGDNDKIAPILQECREMGIKILPPNVNESGLEFKPTIEGIRFGFGAIDSFGDIGSKFLANERAKNGNFKNFLDFVSRVDLAKINKTKLAALIKSGCFDSLQKGINRKELLTYLPDFIEMAKGNEALYFIPHTKDFSDEEKCMMEYEHVGYFISGHPLDGDKSRLSSCVPISESMTFEKGVSVTIGGIITNKSEIRTKKGQLMAKITLEDLRGKIQVVIFPNIYSKHQDLIEISGKIAITGKISNNNTQEGQSVELISDIIRPLKDLDTKGHLVIHIDDLSDLEGIKKCFNQQNIGRKVYLEYRNITFPLKERLLLDAKAIDQLKAKGAVPIT